MKRLFLILGLLVGISQAQTTTTITGTIKDLSQALVTSGKVTFTLQPSRDTTISGLARFSPQQVVCLINASGLIKAQDGTSVCTLTMNTALNPPGTYYRVDVWPFNVKTSSFTFYAVLSTYDWSTVVPTPATSPFQTFVDVISNQTIGGNKIFSGNVTATAGQNVFSAYSVNNLLFVDGGTKYPCTAAGTIALLSDATGQANAEGCLSGFTSTSEIDIGSAIKSGISLIHPSTSTWTFNFNNSSACGVKIFDGTSFSGRGSAASSNGAFTLTAPGTAIMDSLLCTNLTGENYTSAENIRVYSPNGATFTHGALNIENNVDGSWFRNIVAANYSGTGIFWWNNCCAAYAEGLLANGNFGANAVPMLISSDATHNVIATNFFSTSLGHAGAGKNNLAMSNGGNNHWCGGNNFFGLYNEGTGDTTTPSVDVACGATSIFGMRLDNDAASTRYAVQIEANTDGVNVFGLSSTTSTNLINDIVNGIQVTEPAQIPVNYSSMNTWFPFLHIGGPSGGPGGIYNRNLLFSAGQPSLGAGFGTSPSIPTNNGANAFSINVGTGGTATTGTINFNATAANRWVVSCQDRSTFSTTVFTTRQTASTTTSATVGNFNSSAVAAAWVASDILDCMAAAE